MLKVHDQAWANSNNEVGVAFQEADRLGYIAQEKTSDGVIEQDVMSEGENRFVDCTAGMRPPFRKDTGAENVSEHRTVCGCDRNLATVDPERATVDHLIDCSGKEYFA